MSRNVFIVAGMASKGANLAPLSFLGSLHHDEDVHYIDGATMGHTGLVVKSPSSQASEIRKILWESASNESLIYTQSIGAIAAVHCLEAEPVGTTRAIAIAPPLPSPSELLNHPHIVSRMRRSHGQLIIPSYSYALMDNGPSNSVPNPVNVSIDNSYFEDVASSSVDFLARVKQLSDNGLLQLVLPSEDWNIQAQNVASEFNGAVTITATHSLHNADEAAMRASVAEIYKLSTSLPVTAWP